jgi:hypothetical protein
MAKNKQDDAATKWLREQLDGAVDEIMASGIVKDQIAEARPVWSIANKVLIGQVRVASEPKSFIWVICGDYPTDCLPASAAPTARDVARHFSLKWQMDAARQTDAAAMTLLMDKAEELYDIVEEDSLWQEPGDA